MLMCVLSVERPAWPEPWVWGEETLPPGPEERPGVDADIGSGSLGPQLQSAFPPSSLQVLLAGNADFWI